MMQEASALPGLGLGCFREDIIQLLSFYSFSGREGLVLVHLLSALFVASFPGLIHYPSVVRARTPVSRFFLQGNPSNTLHHLRPHRVLSHRPLAVEDPSCKFHR